METLLWVAVPLLVVGALWWWVSRLRKRASADVAAAVGPETAAAASGRIDEETHRAVYRFIAQGNLMGAVQQYRNATGRGVKDSIIDVRSLEQHPQVHRGPSMGFDAGTGGTSDVPDGGPATHGTSHHPRHADDATPPDAGAPNAAVERGRTGSETAGTAGMGGTAGSAGLGGTTGSAGTGGPAGNAGTPGRKDAGAPQGANGAGTGPEHGAAGDGGRPDPGSGQKPDEAHDAGRPGPAPTDGPAPAQEGNVPGPAAEPEDPGSRGAQPSPGPAEAPGHSGLLRPGEAPAVDDGLVIPEEWMEKFGNGASRTTTTFRVTAEKDGVSREFSTDDLPPAERDQFQSLVRDHDTAGAAALLARYSGMDEDAMRRLLESSPVEGETSTAEDLSDFSFEGDGPEGRIHFSASELPAPDRTEFLDHLAGGDIDSAAEIVQRHTGLPLDVVRQLLTAFGQQP